MEQKMKQQQGHEMNKIESSSQDDPSANSEDEDASTEIALKSLYFHDMHSRSDSIAVAHENTFRWIFNEDPTVNNTTAPNTGFLRWLKSGNGTYWVAGKPGCGKSTLMKFLSQHSHTSELLTS
jgi:Tfp pilus assembly pilus retraction ATPase PilT